MLTAWTQVVGAAYKPEALLKTATSLGLDTAAFNACLTGGKYVQQISDNTVAVGKLGIEKLPVVLVNEVKIESLQPWDVYARAIEAELAK